MQTIRQALLGVFLVPTLACTSLYAGPIFAVDSGSTVRASVLFSTSPPAIQAIDVRGSGLVGVFDPAFAGFAYFTDLDPSPGTVNTFLVGVDTPGFTEAVALSFDTMAPTFIGNTLSIPVLGTPFTPSITQPALLPLLGTYSVQFDLASTTPVNETSFLNVYVLQGVPEPSTLGLIGGGLIALLAWRRRR